MHHGQGIIHLITTNMWNECSTCYVINLNFFDLLNQSYKSDGVLVLLVILIQITAIYNIYTLQHTALNILRYFLCKVSLINTHRYICTTHLAVSCSLLPCTWHHFQFSIVGQVGKPPWHREVKNSPLKPEG